ncbi:hypothetical protein BJY17_002801 [Agromyces hippuratus]|uniref:Uncharacterized protein n=1 Tax=Agromyces hippuratus TaxID=286438 RepID=A0A852X3I7_9MICO|nr:hypothetical protein [Agromyces hippuratus]NYG22054.1 hypothetical protein [Agromyces hippuratus]
MDDEDAVFNELEHADLIMRNLETGRGGPIVEISIHAAGIVGIAMYWSAMTFVLFALQSLGIAGRLKDPTLDADGNLVLLLSDPDGAAVDPSVVWRRLDEMGFRATLVGTARTG